MEEKPQLLGTLENKPCQWSFLVPLIGGRYHIIPQLAVTTNDLWKLRIFEKDIRFSKGCEVLLFQRVKWVHYWCMLESRMKHQQPPPLSELKLATMNPPFLLRDLVLLVPWLDKIPNNSDLPWYNKKTTTFNRWRRLKIAKWNTDLFTFYLPISHFRVNIRWALPKYL